MLQKEKTEHMAKLIKDRRNNDIYGETDLVLIKILQKGCTAAFRNPDDNNLVTILGKSNSNLYFIHQVDIINSTGSNNLCEHVSVNILQDLVSACKPLDATPLVVIKREKTIKIYPVCISKSNTDSTIPPAERKPFIKRKLQEML